LFDSVLEALAFAGVGIAMVKAYLVANKIWIRKHERVVAESVSVAAAMLGLLTAAPFLAKHMLAGDASSFVNTITGFIMSCFFLSVGIGLWVRGSTQQGFWRLLLKSLRLESREAGDLARTFLRPAGSRKILEILSYLAMVDRRLHPEEEKFIRSFADSWRLDWTPESGDTRGRVAGGPPRLEAVREATERYLDISPPTEQALQLRDVIHALVSIDEDVTEAEKTIVAELEQMLDAYVEGDKRPRHEVLVVPQSPEQLDAIRNLLSEPNPAQRCGGRAFVVDSFYTDTYAEAICESYRSLNLFTTVERVAGDEASTPDEVTV
jgi:hypothetical protein